MLFQRPMELQEFIRAEDSGFMNLSDTLHLHTLHPKPVWCFGYRV